MTLILNPLDASAYESRDICRVWQQKLWPLLLHNSLKGTCICWAFSLCQAVYASLCGLNASHTSSHVTVTSCDSYMRLVLLFSYPFYGRVKWYSLKARQLTRWQEHGSKTSLASKSTLLLLSLAVLLLISWDFTEGDLLLSAFSFNHANISRVGG